MKRILFAGPFIMTGLEAVALELFKNSVMTYLRLDL